MSRRTGAAGKPRCTARTWYAYGPLRVKAPLLLSTQRVAIQRRESRGRRAAAHPTGHPPAARPRGVAAGQLQACAYLHHVAARFAPPAGVSSSRSAPLSKGPHVQFAALNSALNVSRFHKRARSSERVLQRPARWCDCAVLCAGASKMRIFIKGAQPCTRQPY